MDRRAIVFGARTFLGDQIVAQLVDAGVETGSARAWNEPPSHRHGQGVTDVVVDADPQSLVDALLGRNWVFWTMEGNGSDAETLAAEKVEQVRRLVDAGREAGIDRIIATLPASICWVPDLTITEDHHYLPGTSADPRVDAFYAVHQALIYAAADGIDVVTVAPTLIFGDGARPLDLDYPRDHEKVDLVDVSEAARMHVAAAERAPWGELYLLGGVGVERRHLAEYIPSPRRGFLGRGGDDLRRHLVDPGVRVDPQKACAELGFRPSSGHDRMSP